MKHQTQYVSIVEVGPRDGFQNIVQFIPTTRKIEIIEKLIAAGVVKMEITSFVHSKAVPQMRDAAEVAAAVLAKTRPGFTPVALAPNLTGARKAAALGLREVSYVISVSQAHNEANIRRTHEQSLAELMQIKQELPELAVRVDLATAFGCPFAGPMPLLETLAFIERVRTAGVTEIILCDTIGVANPRQVAEMVSAARSAYPELSFGLHLHDTRGLGLANTLAGLETGIHTIEVAAGGLGGCPFAPGASGNTATEDLLNMLSGMGIETGINLERYMEAVELIRKYVQSELPSHMAGVYGRKSCE